MSDGARIPLLVCWAQFAVDHPEWSDRRLADVLGVSNSTVSRWRREYDPSSVAPLRRVTQEQIAAAAGCSKTTLQRRLTNGKRERDQAASRAWKLRHRGTCIDCGRSVGWDSTRCPACHRMHRLRPHGTDGRYNAGCRCDGCRAAHTAVCKACKQRRRNVPPKVHNASTYRNYGCRCDVCRRANSEKSAEYARRRREAVA